MWYKIFLKENLDKHSKILIRQFWKFFSNREIFKKNRSNGKSFDNKPLNNKLNLMENFFLHLINVKSGTISRLKL